MAEELKTYMGTPIEPHEVTGVEAVTIICNQCGWEVDGDRDSWWHVDPKYGPQDDEEGIDG